MGPRRRSGFLVTGLEQRMWVGGAIRKRKTLLARRTGLSPPWVTEPAPSGAPELSTIGGDCQSRPEPARPPCRPDGECEIPAVPLAHREMRTVLATRVHCEDRFADAWSSHSKREGLCGTHIWPRERRLVLPRSGSRRTRGHQPAGMIRVELSRTESGCRLEEQRGFHRGNRLSTQRGSAGADRSG